MSAAEVLAAIPEAEGSRERLSSIVSQLSENGITVRIDSDTDRGASAVVEFLVNNGLLPFTSIFIEPAKVLAVIVAESGKPVTVPERQ